MHSLGLSHSWRSTCHLNLYLHSHCKSNVRIFVLWWIIITMQFFLYRSRTRKRVINPSFACLPEGNISVSILLLRFSPDWLIRQTTTPCSTPLLICRWVLDLLTMDAVKSTTFNCLGAIRIVSSTLHLPTTLNSNHFNHQQNKIRIFGPFKLDDDTRYRD